MINKTKRELRNAKGRATMWTIFTVLMIVIAISLVAMLGAILDIPGWVRVVIGALLYGTGQGMLTFMSLASYEFDYVGELKKYLTELEELDL